MWLFKRLKSRGSKGKLVPFLYDLYVWHLKLCTTVDPRLRNDVNTQNCSNLWHRLHRDASFIQVATPLPSELVVPLAPWQRSESKMIHSSEANWSWPLHKVCKPGATWPLHSRTQELTSIYHDCLVLVFWSSCFGSRCFVSKAKQPRPVTKSDRPQQQWVYWVKRMHRHIGHSPRIWISALSKQTQAVHFDISTRMLIISYHLVNLLGWDLEYSGISISFYI